MQDENRLLDLKKQLREELGKEKSDNNLIIKLSGEIAALDESQVRFSVDAAIISRLGKELVGRHETAVSELVKNAYDADAVEVKLIFENTNAVGGKLYIQDNGLGMTRAQLINGFMRLSSSDKIHNPKSPRYGRTRAGKKGIGRFATQRLGAKLTIVTQTLESEQALRVEIDWDRFGADIDLLSIANSIVAVPKAKEEGTDLIIESLRESWSEATIKRVYRYTSELLQPFPLSKKRKSQEKERVDPGFKSAYYRKVGDQSLLVIDEEEAFLKHSLAEFEGFVLDNGQGCWTLKSKKLGVDEEVFDIGKNVDDTQSRFKYIRDVHFKCYYFIYDDELLPPQQRAFIREVGNERGGLRLYRNGFRVLPYAERGNDWLRFDESVRKRIILPAHANNSFFGFVEITDEAGINYEETSSREGLIENEAFEELKDFVYRSVIAGVLRVAELRGRKGRASQKNWKKPELSPAEKVDSAISKIKEVFEKSRDNNEETENNGNQRDEQFDQVFGELLEGRAEEKAEKQRLIEENNMLRVLAGLGLVIGEFVHEVKRFLPAFDTDVRFLKRQLKGNLQAEDRLERLGTNIRSFTTYTSYFDKTVSRNVLRDLVPIELRDVVSDFAEVIRNDLERTGILLERPVFEGIDLFTRPMHPSEWASILFNFYTNSKKAIKRKGAKGRLMIKCGSHSDNVYLEFSDNGDGIPKENEEVIFNAFFTTASASGHSATEAEALTGTGLGLKIVKDIIESYEGEIYVSSPQENYTTTIRIEIPKYSKEEQNGEA